MHRYRIVARIYLILSILNLVLAAPVVVQRMYEVRADDLPDLEMGVAAAVEDMEALPGELEAASNRPTSPLGSPPSPNAMASPQHSLDGSMSLPPSPNAMASLQHSLDGPMSPRPSSPNAMASPQHSLDGSMSPRPSSPNAMASPQHSLGGPMSPPSSPNVIVSPHHSLDGSATSGYPTPHLSSASSASGYSWMLERLPRLSPMRPVSPHATASSPPGGLASSHNSIPEGSPSENANLPTGKKLGIITELAIIGGILGTVWGLHKLSKLTHRDSQER
jgi:hypothetical protein